MSQSEYKAIAQNVLVQVGIGFGFTSSHWLKKWSEFCWPNIEHTNANPKQMQFTLDTRLKTTLIIIVLLSSSIFTLIAKDLDLCLTEHLSSVGLSVATVLALSLPALNKSLGLYPGPDA